MNLSNAQEFSNQVLPQNDSGNYFHVSHQIDLKKEKPVRAENNGLTLILKKLWKEDIPGKKHIENYLRDQYRRNLRLSTIENSLTAIVSFIVLVLYKSNV